MRDVLSGSIDRDEVAGRADAELTPRARVRAAEAPSRNETHWLIDNAEAYAPLLDSLRSARRSIHIAQLAFDADCAAYSSDATAGSPSREAVIAETLIDCATAGGPEIRILLNASWILNTARPLRK